MEGMHSIHSTNSNSQLEQLRHSLLSMEAQSTLQGIIHSTNYLQFLFHSNPLGPFVSQLIQSTSGVHEDIMRNKYLLERKDNVIPIGFISVFFGNKILGFSQSVSRMSNNSKMSIERDHLHLSLGVEFILGSIMFHSVVTEALEKQIKMKIMLGDLLITQFYSQLSLIKSSLVALQMNVLFATLLEISFESDYPQVWSELFEISFGCGAILSGGEENKARKVGQLFGQLCQVRAELQTELPKTEGCLETQFQICRQWIQEYVQIEFDTSSEPILDRVLQCIGSIEN